MLTTIKEEIHSNTIIVGDFNISLTPMDRSPRQKINKERQALNDTIDQTDLTDIYRTFYLKVADYTFFSSAYRTFSRIDQILGHKSNLGKFKKIEIISSIFSDHNAMRLAVNYRGKNVKKHKHMEAEEIKEEIKRYLETNDNENTTILNLCDAAKAILRGK